MQFFASSLIFTPGEVRGIIMDAIHSDKTDATVRVPSNLADAAIAQVSREETQSPPVPAHDGLSTQETTSGRQTFRQYAVVIALFVSYIPWHTYHQTMLVDKY